MTKSELEKAREPVPALFASGLNADCHKVGTEASGFSYQNGIPAVYSSLSGMKVCRGDINGLGRSITQSKWFNQLGGYYTFDEAISEAIGGYPEGAVLKYKDPQTGYVREVRSLIPDNSYNFVETPDYINDEYWSYVDNVPPSSFRPRIFPMLNDVSVGTLFLGQELTIEMPCLFMIETGVNSMDCTNDGSDYTMFLAVKNKNQEEFYTAGLVCYLPALASVLTQGIIQDKNNVVKFSTSQDMSVISDKLEAGFHAYNSPSPIQIYLTAESVVKLSESRAFDAIKTESFRYWIYPLAW